MNNSPQKQAIAVSLANLLVSNPEKDFAWLQMNICLIRFDHGTLLLFSAVISKLPCL